MLTGLYITLRFGHFISLMLAFGCVLYGAWWAPVPLRRVLMLRFYPLLRPLLLIGAISTLALYLLQGGMMGEGWGMSGDPPCGRRWPGPALVEYGSGSSYWRGSHSR